VICGIHNFVFIFRMVFFFAPWRFVFSKTRCLDNHSLVWPCPWRHCNAHFRFSCWSVFCLRWNKVVQGFSERKRACRVWDVSRAFGSYFRVRSSYKKTKNLKTFKNFFKPRFFQPWFTHTAFNIAPPWSILFLLIQQQSNYGCLTMSAVTLSC